MKLWVVGKYIQFYENKGSIWEFQGIFDSYEKALEACHTISYFIAPAILNESFPDETIEWEGLVYPLYVTEQ